MKFECFFNHVTSASTVILLNWSKSEPIDKTASGVGTKLTDGAPRIDLVTDNFPESGSNKVFYSLGLP